VHGLDSEEALAEILYQTIYLANVLLFLRVGLMARTYICGSTWAKATRDYRDRAYGFPISYYSIRVYRLELLTTGLL
jgi:hypothetical protein